MNKALLDQYFDAAIIAFDEEMIRHQLLQTHTNNKDEEIENFFLASYVADNQFAWFSYTYNANKSKQINESEAVRNFILNLTERTYFYWNSIENDDRNALRDHFVNSNLSNKGAANKSVFPDFVTESLATDRNQVIDFLNHNAWFMVFNMIILKFQYTQFFQSLLTNQSEPRND